MVRTINRQPYSVKELDYDDIKYKFFNHSNWKGVCDDKNYLSVDQETFADSKNIYVDSEGILKSRPSVKFDTTFPYQDGTVSSMAFKNVYTFGSWYVLHRGDNKLELRKVGVTSSKGISNTITEDYKLIQVDQKIFVFRKNKLSYFDMTANFTDAWIEDASNKVYIPVTETVQGLVHTEAESPNVLTSKTITSYIYDYSDDNLPTAELVGKTISVRIGNTQKEDNTYSNYQNGVELTINTKVYQIDKTKNFINDMPLFWTNDAGYVLLGEKETATETVSEDSFKNYTLYYSNNGLTYTQLPYLDNTWGLPALSKSADHIFAVLFKSDGPYAYTLFGGELQSDGSRIPYTTWTKLVSPDGSINWPEHGCGIGDFVDETLFSFFRRGTNKLLCTYKDGTYIEHTVDVGPDIMNPIGDDPCSRFSVCCAKDVTVVVYSLFDLATGGGYQSYAVYNTYDATINNFYGTTAGTNYINALPVGITTAAKERQTVMRIKQRIYNNGVYVAFAEGDDYIVDDKLRFTLKYTYVSETDVSTHATTISDEQRLTNIRTLTKNIGHAAPPVTNRTYYIALSSNLSIVNEMYFVQGANCITKYRYGCIPLGFVGEYFYDYRDSYLNDICTIYSTQLNTLAYLYVENDGELSFDVFDHETELSQFFVSKGKKLYINAQGSNTDIDDFKWYFPKQSVQEFDYDITHLHPISTTEIAVFLQDSIYYVKPTTTTTNDIETVVYTYYKSRIPLGCEEGSDVITSYDNVYTMFTTKRGFVAMSYQDFVSSEEQALTFLSDSIYDVFSKWNKGAIKLFQYNFWIILYRLDTGFAYIFDMRGNSWWPIEYNSNVKKFFELDRKPYILSGLYVYKLDKSNDNYFDGSSLNTGRIDWFLSSQKLHLNAINYYKHLINLTFFGYNYGDKDATVRFNLRVINYRKQTDTNETKSFSAVEYKIQLLRTFVTRINYYKVNQVQYILESSRGENEEDKIPVPLSLTAISLKYLVTGQVR